jgi:hypothetical protein
MLEIPATDTPIACDMSTAPDTVTQRMAEYQRLFSQAFVSKERTAEGIRFRLRAGDGIEAWVRDLVAKEKACCAFFGFRVAVEGGEVLWDTWVIDDDTARAILDEYYALPETAGHGAQALERRLNGKGLEVAGDPAGVSEFRLSA